LTIHHDRDASVL